MCSLTVCGERKSRSAISRLVAPEAISVEHLALARGERRRRRLLLAARRRSFPCRPSARPGDVVGAPVLGDEARGAGGARRLAARSSRRRRSAAPGSRGETAADRLAELGAGPLAEEEVDEGDVRASAASRGSSASSASEAATQRSTQRWLAEQHRKPHWTTSWSSTISTRSGARRSADRLRHEPSTSLAAAPAAPATRRPSGPNSSIPPRCSDSRRPAAGPCPEPAPRAARASRRFGPRARRRRRRVLTRPAPRSARRASRRCEAPRARTDDASGSSPSGTSAPGSHSTLIGAALYWRPRRSSSARSVVRGRFRGRRRASGSSASRRSASAAWISAAQRSRVGGAQLAAGAEHHRDAEQPLHDALVHLAGELDPVAAAARRARAGRPPGGRSSRAPRCGPSARIVWRSLVVEVAAAAVAVGEDHPEPAPGGGDGGAARSRAAVGSSA